MLALFTGLSVLMTFPLITHFTTAIPGAPGDNFEYLYKLWWFKYTLLDARVSPFFNPNVFYPHGFEVALSETTLSNMLLGLPLTALFGEITSYNTLVLASFAFSGFATYLFVWYLTQNRIAATVSGVTFAFSPYRMAAVSAGHLPLIGTQWLPLMFLFLEMALRRRQLRFVALAALSYGLFALSSWYYGYIGMLLLMTYLLARTRPWRKTALAPVVLKGAVLFVAIAAALTLPSAIPLIHLYLQGQGVGWTQLAYVDLFSASLTDFLLPNPANTLWGSWLLPLTGQNFHENLLSLGVVPLLLSAACLRRERSLVTIALAITGIVALVLSLGPTLHITADRVYLPAPDWLARQFSRLGYILAGRLAPHPLGFDDLMVDRAIFVPLPSFLVMLFLPFSEVMRGWSRFAVGAIFAVSVLAGIGLNSLSRAEKKTRATSTRTLISRSRVLNVVALGAVLIEFASFPLPFGISTPIDQPAVKWLAQQPGDFAVIEYPIGKTFAGPPLYYARLHGKKIAYGYSTFTPRAYLANVETLNRFPETDAIDLLASWNVRYVLVSVKAYGNEWPDTEKNIENQPRLSYVSSFREYPLVDEGRLLGLLPVSDLRPVYGTPVGGRLVFEPDDIRVYEISRKS